MQWRCRGCNKTINDGGHKWIKQADGYRYPFHNACAPKADGK